MDERVTIDEIILGVRIALGKAAPDACGVGGPGVGIDGLVTAVLNALAGCTNVRDLSAFDQGPMRGRGAECPSCSTRPVDHTSPNRPELLNSSGRPHVP